MFLAALRTSLRYFPRILIYGVIVSSFEALVPCCFSSYTKPKHYKNKETHKNEIITLKMKLMYFAMDLIIGFFGSSETIYLLTSLLSSSISPNTSFVWKLFFRWASISYLFFQKSSFRFLSLWFSFYTFLMGLSRRVVLIFMKNS